MGNVSKYDIHKFDKFIKFLGSANYVMAFAFLMIACGVVISTITKEWMWFSRFGALVTISGLLLTSSPLFVKGIYLSVSGAFGFASRDEDGNSRVVTPQARKIGDAVFLGIVITIFGTLIWGFGDLLDDLFNVLESLFYS